MLAALPFNRIKFRLYQITITATHLVLNYSNTTIYGIVTMNTCVHTNTCTCNIQYIIHVHM